MIVILCQRYGPTLKPAGFPDVSATHLEYNEAKKLGKPIYMYVRDRLEADYSISKKNKKADVQPVWAQHEQYRRLFDLLDGHRKLSKGKHGSNWFDTFRDSVELKALIKRDFGPVAARSELEDLVVQNRVPIIGVSVDATPPQNASSCEMMIHIRMRNVGTVPAYRLSWNLAGGNGQRGEIPILAPKQETHQGVVYPFDDLPWKRAMSIAYCMSQGHSVRDEYTVGVRQMSQTVLASGATCESKTYHVASGEMRPFVIIEAKDSDDNI